MDVAYSDTRFTKNFPLLSPTILIYPCLFAAIFGAMPRPLAISLLTLAFRNLDFKLTCAILAFKIQLENELMLLGWFISPLC